ncbi:FAD-dependent oxidoreductase [Streptomyces sp. NBC_00328]|uniref:FAD-dependent oxidoreductase n=1 Tax=Streptomyces sp. NBC_00328 TaxID=2903646 RepID=UPI002E2E47FF|nr:FAD-dependent oxidoreductase [Streptomyces sp. NBC_00328]
MTGTSAEGRVLVAGAGPVGLTAALVLARRGAPVTVLEAGPGLSSESRASTFHPPTLEMLEDLGVLGPVLEQGLIVRTFQYRDRRTGPVAELDLAVLAPDTRHPYRVQLEQGKLTPLLLRALSRLPGSEVRFGTRVTAVRQDPHGVDAVLSDGTTARGSHLVAADGAHSAVRRSLEVGFHGMTYPERFLVASVEDDLTAELPGLAPIAYVMDPDEWLVLLRTPDHWRILLPTPGDTTDAAELARLPGRLRALRAASAGRTGPPWRVVQAGLYRVHQRVADTFRLGRILLCGDAAHVNNPLGGMGMNSGIHDAVLMGAALHAVADGRTGADEALDRVAAARRDCALTYVGAQTHRNWERLRVRDPALRSALADELRATAADPARARQALLRSSMIASLRMSV